MNIASGTVRGQLSAGTLRFSDGTLQVTAPVSGGGGGYAIEPATVTIQADKGISGSTMTLSTSLTVPQLNVTNITLSGSISGLAASSPNGLDNGGMEVSQRGVTFATPADAAFTADRWKVQTDEAAGVTVTKNTTTVDTGLASLRVVVASPGASKYWYVKEIVENYADYRGQTITVSARAHSSVASAVKVSLSDGLVSSSTFHTGGGGWETLSATLLVRTTATVVSAQIGMLNAGDKKAGTYYFDSLMLAPGSSAPTFAPLNAAVDMYRCQRFYQRFGGNIAGEQLAMGQDSTTADFRVVLFFPVRMRIAPTLTVVGTLNIFKVLGATGLALSCTDLTTGNISVNSAALFGTVASGLTAGAVTILYTNTTAAYIEASADL